MLSDFLTPWFIIRFVIVGLVLAVIGLLVALVVYFGGFISFAANTKDPVWFYKLVHNAFKQSVSSHASDIEVPSFLDDPGRIALGAQHYAQNCVRCHGAPGLGQNPMALSIKPTPQHLPAVVDQFSDAELFWILQNGVMMSAMPAWPTSGREDEVWSMVAFTRQLDDMDVQTYLDLVTPDVDAGPQIAFGDTPELDAMNYHLIRYPQDEHLYAAPTGGFADYALAGIPVAQCTTCHGADGSGSPTNGEAPNLTLQTPEYLAAALHSYAEADRKSGYMQVVAAQLSDEQIDGLATYFGETLPDAASPVAPAPEEGLIEAGLQLAEHGDILNGIPACYDCHGATEPGAGILVPALAGQSETYIRAQLLQFRGNGRGQVAVWNPMRGVAHEIEDDQIAAVSAYFASLEPGAGRSMNAAPGPVTPETEELATGIISRVCSECHQANLAGVPSGEYPNLTLQSPNYLQRSLYAFHTDRRNNSRMHETARIMSEDEMDAVAAYIGDLPAEPSAPAPDLPGDVALGAQIVEAGLPDRGIPACLTCHGPEPTTDLKQIPRLHGQNANYLAARLDYFQGREAEERLINPMPGYASRMTDEELAAAASWFATQEPLSKEMALVPVQ
ncbi:cytochrome c553 [Palleronia aestuarii]|uniref:Cytochrome c553 n=1 Tax=Palleronia aestuarii TaxID=568105 RepID=A0A2W7N1M0_9RHOB|nr:c-type cytochrome [Palleronia aestuarii]PZX12267.1 cytochrome c553 [Palleronia aestuarii]